MLIGEIIANSCENIGGIVGKNYGTISDSKSSIIISGDAQCVGGIVGFSEQGNIYKCINEGKITGSKYVGGICGYMRKTRIDSCGNEEKIFASLGYAGGIIRICRKWNWWCCNNKML